MQTLQNDHWQVGILPETGSSTAFGRVRRGDQWLDVLRPTAEADYGNASLCSSFIMLPWCNRLREARFRFAGRDYPLQPSNVDGTAIHGTVRRLAWQIASAEPTRLVTTFDSAAFAPDQINFPFHFSARAEFWLDGFDFHLMLAIHNEDSQPFPAGFGHHPYFVRDPENRVQVQVLCDQRFDLVDNLAAAPPVALDPASDFRAAHSLSEQFFQQLYTDRQGDLAARVIFPDAALSIFADPLFQHVLVYAPTGEPFFAVEPMSNANDGFNLFDKGIEGSGVFVLQPGESQSGSIRLHIE